MTSNVLQFIEEHLKEETPARRLVLNKLLDDIFDYEQSIDGEYCCHSDKQIRQGMCEATKPEDIEAIRHMAEFWGGPPKRIQEED